jgi:hypothetical protein
VDVRALFLLLGCVGRLHDEDGLDEEEEGSGVEELERWGLGLEGGRGRMRRGRGDVRGERRRG